MAFTVACPPVVPPARHKMSLLLFQLGVARCFFAYNFSRIAHAQCTSKGKNTVFEECSGTCMQGSFILVHHQINVMLLNLQPIPELYRSVGSCLQVQGWHFR